MPLVERWWGESHLRFAGRQTTVENSGRIYLYILLANYVPTSYVKTSFISTLLPNRLLYKNLPGNIPGPNCRLEFPELSELKKSVRIIDRATSELDVNNLGYNKLDLYENPTRAAT
jgi:hypothetical protein